MENTTLIAISGGGIALIAFVWSVSSGIKKQKKQAEEADRKDSEERDALVKELSEIEKNLSNFEEVKQKILNKATPIKDARVLVKRSVYNVAVCEKHGQEIGEKLLNEEWFLGMTEEMLTDAKGSPTKIEEEVMKTKTKMVYIYGNKSSGDIFTFVDGELERFKVS